MLASNLVEESVEAVIAAAVDGAESDLLAVNPSLSAIDAVVDVLSERSDPPRVRLLADEGPIKDLMDDFLVASAAADLVAAEDLAIRTSESVPRTSLLVSEEAVVSLVEGGTLEAGLVTTDDAFVDGAADYYEGRWVEAEPYSLRTPPLSTVRETLETDIGEATARDFEGVLDSLATARGDGDGLDEVTISLLVAARNRELLYDISKWGEDVGLASKATFSRTKTRLEEKGLVDTEKVPIDVGRPRLRLKLGDERLADADVDELASVAGSLLAT